MYQEPGFVAGQEVFPVWRVLDHKDFFLMDFSMVFVKFHGRNVELQYRTILAPDP
jgi:hypothetical protein